MSARSSRVLAAVAAALVLAAHAPGATAQESGPPPFDQPGRTDAVVLESTTELDGWRYDHYRNPDYPCAIEGDQTFTIATRLGTEPEEERPLWVFLHGGGVGWFEPDGSFVGGRDQKVEEPASQQIRSLARTGDLIARVRELDPGFRLLAVSMCSHDIYGGPDIVDPNNPNTTPDGSPRTVNGLYATKAAVQHTMDLHATDGVILHGGSAGSYGAYHVGWSLEQQGLAPQRMGIIADSGVLNQEWQEATLDLPGCGRPPGAREEIPRRLHPAIVDPANEPHLLVSSGRLGIPVADVFSVADRSQCGQQPIECVLPDGSTVTLGSVECMHEPMRRAIAGLGDDTASFSMRLCVDRADGGEPCAAHVPTRLSGGVNTDPAWPGDYNAVLLDWALERLGRSVPDDGPAGTPPAETGPGDPGDPGASGGATPEAAPARARPGSPALTG